MNNDPNCSDFKSKSPKSNKFYKLSKVQEIDSKTLRDSLNISTGNLTSCRETKDILFNKSKSKLNKTHSIGASTFMEKSYQEKNSSDLSFSCNNEVIIFFIIFRKIILI